jgi:hypothetical protein
MQINMTTNTLIKLGQVTILTTVFTASNLLLVEASDLHFAGAGQTQTSSKRNFHHVSDVQVHGHASDSTRFNTIDGEPLNSPN